MRNRWIMNGQKLPRHRVNVETVMIRVGFTRELANRDYVYGSKANLNEPARPEAGAGSSNGIDRCGTARPRWGSHGLVYSVSPRRAG
jgi:hypothetical protein